MHSVERGVLTKLHQTGISVHRSQAVIIQENMMMFAAQALPLLVFQGCCMGHGGCAVYQDLRSLNHREDTPVNTMNQARGFAYLFGVLKNQQADPICRSCNSFVKTLAAARESLTAFEAKNAEEIKSASSEVTRLLIVAKNSSDMLEQADNPLRQKKEGNCKLPEGVCFTKSSLAILQKV